MLKEKTKRNQWETNLPTKKKKKEEKRLRKKKKSNVMLKVKRESQNNKWETDFPTKKKRKKKNKSVMFETKATLKKMGKLFAKRIATFICDTILASLLCLLGSNPKFKFNFATKKKKRKKKFNSFSTQIHLLL